MHDWWTPVAWALALVGLASICCSIAVLAYGFALTLARRRDRLVLGLIDGGLVTSPAEHHAEERGREREQQRRAGERPGAGPAPAGLRLVAGGGHGWAGEQRVAGGRPA